MLKYIPFFGLVVYFHNFIFVNRKKFNAQAADNALRMLKERGLPFWLILYPEGTRINPSNSEVFTKSVQFAKTSCIEPFTYHLTPRSTGLELVFKNLAQQIDAVYDVTIVYADENGNPRDRRLKMPGLTNWLEFTHSIHVHIDRIPIKNVPTSEKEQFKKWLFDRFRIKETFFKRLYEPSRYKDEESAKRVGSRVKPLTACVPWKEYVELEPPSLQHTKNVFNNSLKPSTGSATSVNSSDGTLKPLSFADTWLPTMTFIGISFFLAYLSFKLYLLTMLISYLAAGVGLVFLHQTD
ncbi:1-acyl-sn-glycerol-3-phosphate acyltransferase epsilon [Cichlidogyrus casuarinus]|uniref:1-acyl-sn-glycerol-3-phosphate acyltransferase epsilon n=1 Tax=Cichlidogyrus casuarinus TaxID=1844966 RepID=A0ABD2QAE8_9PLAT